jgi:hypothetical protein
LEEGRLEEEGRWVGRHVPALHDAAAEVAAVLTLHGNVLCAIDLGVECCSVASLALSSCQSVGRSVSGGGGQPSSAMPCPAMSCYAMSVMSWRDIRGRRRRQ